FSNRHTLLGGVVIIIRSIHVLHLECHVHPDSLALLEVKEEHCSNTTVVCQVHLVSNCARFINFTRVHLRSHHVTSETLRDILERLPRVRVNVHCNITSPRCQHALNVHIQELT